MTAFAEARNTFNTAIEQASSADDLRTALAALVPATLDRIDVLSRIEGGSASSEIRSISHRAALAEYNRRVEQRVLGGPIDHAAAIADAVLAVSSVSCRADQERFIDRIGDVILAHLRTDITGCRCGWSELGRSHSHHVAREVAAELGRQP